MMEYLFWLSVVLASYPYTLFPGALWLLSLFAASRPGPHSAGNAAPGPSPAFSMIVAAHNEGARIVRKIEESIPALALDPANELIVVSDYSADDTVAAARSIRHPQVRVIENGGVRGKAGATNYTVPLAMNELLVLSDVETRVPTETVAQMIEALRQPRIGCVNAEIVFVNAAGDQVAEVAGRYWRFEMWLRSRETTLDLYATSSGPCMAVRRSLFRELPPTGDTDFTTPLDVVDAGYRCVHMAGCIAFDVLTSSAKVEFRTRVRMVAKNFSGTILRWGWRNVFRRPFCTWALYSHKILRWLTPFFLLVALASNVVLAPSGWLYRSVLMLQAAFYAAAFVGWMGYRRGHAWPILVPLYAFVLANAAFAVGVLKSVLGTAPSFFMPTRQLQK